MKFWGFDWVSWLIVSWVSFGFSYFMYVVSWVFSGSCYGVSGFVSPYVCFDWVSLYLVSLSVFISFCVIGLRSWLGLEVLFLVLGSQFFSLLCYVCCHAIFFWAFYEISILILLYLLLKYSPYSERYAAFWYFTGYVFFCSLPMLMVFIYFSLCFGSFSVLGWEIDLCDDWWVLLLMCVLFVTKIPLFPFQAWLPIVHAEASSVVSICLSGYIMKLGVLGVFRFGYWVVPDFLFNDFYVGVILVVSLFVFLCSSFELDGKRWLAFLSLSHIGLVPVCFCVAADGGINVGFCYCLGHGLSSCVTFVLFWYLSEVSGSRNWIMMKSVVSGFWGWELVAVFCFCVCGSFPTSLQFFSELAVLCRSELYGGLVFYLLLFYLFFSALVVLVCLGTLLVRCRSVRPCSGLMSGPFPVFVFLVLLNFVGFLFF